MTLLRELRANVLEKILEFCLKSLINFIVQSQAIKMMAGKVSYLENLMSAEVEMPCILSVIKKQTGLPFSCLSG